MYDFTDLICSGVDVCEVSPAVFSVFGSGSCGYLFALCDGTWAYCEQYEASVNIADTPYDAVHGAITDTAKSHNPLKPKEWIKW